jgi:hypothetical protein
VPTPAPSLAGLCIRDASCFNSLFPCDKCCSTGASVRHSRGQACSQSPASRPRLASVPQSALAGRCADRSDVECPHSCRSRRVALHIAQR